MVAFSEKYKVAFIHIPRTGGSSVTAALLPFLSLREGASVRSVRKVQGKKGWQFPCHAHGHMHDSYKDGFMGDKYQYFTVVRNPWDRAVSLAKKYTDYGQVGELARNGASRQRKYAKPQMDWLKGSGGKVWTLRFENLVEDFMLFCRTLKIPFEGEFPHENNENLGNYRDHYKSDPMAIQMIGKKYRDDVANLGYKVEP